MSHGAEATCVSALGAELGEGPVWRADEGALWFVDIQGHRIHRFDPATGELRAWDAPAQPGFLAPVEGGGWIAGLKTGLHRFDPGTGGFTHLLTIDDPALDNRLNDGFVDAQGRLWFGSMHDPEVAVTGALYRFDAAGLTQSDAGYCITNGPAMSPDGRTLYHTDTLQKVIYAFDVADDATLSNRRVFAQIEDGAGYPDGPAVDAEGHVWSGLFGGWGVRRYSPTGEVSGFVPFPCANVTKIAFGGPDLKTAYATTAWKGLDAAAREAQPLAGGLFAFAVDTPGLPQHEVGHV
jgi:D-xylonolactonase